MNTKIDILHSIITRAAAVVFAEQEFQMAWCTPSATLPQGPSFALTIWPVCLPHITTHHHTAGYRASVRSSRAATQPWRREIAPMASKPATSAAASAAPAARARCCGANSHGVRCTKSPTRRLNRVLLMRNGEALPPLCPTPRVCETCYRAPNRCAQLDQQPHVKCRRKGMSKRCQKQFLAYDLGDLEFNFFPDVGRDEDVTMEPAPCGGHHSDLPPCAGGDEDGDEVLDSLVAKLDPNHRELELDLTSWVGDVEEPPACQSPHLMAAGVDRYWNPCVHGQFYAPVTVFPQAQAGPFGLGGCPTFPWESYDMMDAGS